ncbi:WD40-repeat-containing domain protein [Lenzites betulinus]|nr:WD40-repeat-containing domain protein [Lenzites betulinus]
MVLKYLESARLGRDHTTGVSALAFSSDGLFLASAAVDGKACIWNTSDSRLLHVFSSAVPILSLTWATPGEDTVICGLQDGTVVSLVITPVDLIVTGFWAHSYPVECLTVKCGFLASGAHKEVKIWKQVDSEWDQEIELQTPPKTSFNRHLPLIVTSVHWMPADPHEKSHLIVTYLNHGVHIFDGANWEQIRSIPIPGQIADASISSDAKLIAISNVTSGFDVYSVQSGQAICSLGHTIGEHRKIPVLFVHDGFALVGGNMQGNVHLWDVQSGRKLHSLLHHKDDQVLALAAHYDPVKDTFLIATGILCGSSESSTIVWKAEDLGRDNILLSGQPVERKPTPWVPIMLAGLALSIATVVAIIPSDI